MVIASINLTINFFDSGGRRRGRGCGRGGRGRPRGRGRPCRCGNGADIDAAGIIADVGNPIPNGGRGRCRRLRSFAYLLW
uniref:Uncharacterized protein n=1 Tax=Romanomermis culicivorax TaxID=13658 RepID=A0A915KA12_ROMCU